MTGKSHSVGGTLGGLLCFSVLKDKGYLLQDVSEPLQMLVIYASSMYGSLLPDEDHNKESAPLKDVVSLVIWWVLHFTTPLRKWLQNGGKIRKWLYKKYGWVIGLFDAKHRSWQTHSDLFLIVVMVVALFLPSFLQGDINAILIIMIFEGLLSGIISHLILDMLTPEGIWSFLLVPIKIIGRKLSKKEGSDNVKSKLARVHLVPSMSFFSTKGENSRWERLFRRIMIMISFILLIRIFYFWQPYRLVFSFR